MSGESNLQVLLKTMHPVLHECEYGYGKITLGQNLPEGLNWFALVREDRELTIVASVE